MFDVVVAVHSWRVALPRASGVWTEWEHMRIRQDPHHSPKTPTDHALKPMVQRSSHVRICAVHSECIEPTSLVGVPGGWRRRWEPVRCTGMAGKHPTDIYTLARRV